MPTLKFLGDEKNKLKKIIYIFKKSIDKTKILSEEWGNLTYFRTSPHESPVVIDSVYTQIL